MPAERSFAARREIAGVAGQQAALPVGDALTGVGFVLLLGGAENGELRVAAIDQVGIGHQAAKILVAPLKGGVFEQNFGERFGMGVEQFDAFAAGARQRLRLGFLHGVEHGVEQVERDDHQHTGERIGALQFPGDSGGVARQVVGARLGVDAVGLDIACEADVAHGIGVGIGVLEMGAMAGIRVGKDDLRADFEAGADGLGERVGGLDGDVDGLIFAGVLVRVDDDGDFGQARNGAHPGGLQGSRQFEGDDLGPGAQDGRTHFDGKFQPPGDDGKVGEAAARQAARIRNRKVDFSGHSVRLPLPAPG